MARRKLRRTRSASPGPARRSRVLAPLGVLLVVLLLAGSRLLGFYVDLLWFREVDYASVFTTVLATRALLFAVAGVVVATFVGANVLVAYRLRPEFRPNSLEQQNLERYRVAVDPYRRSALLGIAAAVGVLAGIVASTRWQTWLLWRHQVPFGVREPQFDRDISYFMFTYPFERLLLGFAFAAVVLSLVAAAATHYLYGGIRLQTAGEKVVAPARAHLSVLLGVFVLLKAFAYYLDQFGLAFSQRGKVTGASYTDVHAELPALRILVVIAFICAVLFVANLRSRGWALPATAFGLLLVSSVAIGGLYPAVVQQLRVKPNEVRRESPYIKRNIDATRAAYKLRPDKDVTYLPYAGDAALTARDIETESGTLDHVRLLDPNYLRPTFETLQQIRGYYGLPENLDIDRYEVDGEVRTLVVAAREIDHGGLVANQKNWINEHLIFTHGYGFIAAPTDAVDRDGKPAFTVKDIPPTGPIAISQPRVYYGELAPEYSVVRTDEKEIDRPVEGGVGEQRFTYDGKGGVSIGSPLRRLAFAAHFGSRYLLLSSALRGDSKIMYVRDPADRVKRVAPYLTLDEDPYPAVIGGRIVWVVDGYTTSDGYPYSQRVGFGDVTAASGQRAQTQREINYLRNSVKATVDAYDGTVTLYAWDAEDPLLKTWSRAFPDTLRPSSEMPPELVAHVRYPEDLFKVQRTLIANYHVDDPGEFYTEEDFWDVPRDPAGRLGVPPGTTRPKQPPYYQYFQMPGDDAERFLLTSPLVARRRPNLAAFAAVRSDAEGYGQITVLELPTNTAVQGPEQRGATFTTNPVASSQLTLLGQQGSQVLLGNLLTLPVKGALVFVQPVYVQASGEVQLPQLKRVLVGYGDRVGFAETLDEALAQVFSGAPPPATPGEPADPGTSETQLRQAIADANAAYQEGLAALSRQDLAGYAAAQKKLEAALARAATLSSGSAPSPSPTPR